MEESDESSFGGDRIAKFRRVKLEEAVGAIRRGRICLVPTDTTYALAASVDREIALENLALLKGRSAEKVFSIMVSDMSMAHRYAQLGSLQAMRMRRVLPGQVTVIVTAKPGLSSSVVSEGKVAIRIPARPTTRELVRRCGVAVTATSANLSGSMPAFSVEDFLSQIQECAWRGLLDAAVDEGPLPMGEASTIVDITGEAIRIVREGCVTADALMKTLGET